MVQLSHPDMTTGKTIALTPWFISCLTLMQAGLEGLLPGISGVSYSLPRKSQFGLQPDPKRSLSAGPSGQILTWCVALLMALGWLALWPGPTLLCGSSSLSLLPACPGPCSVTLGLLWPCWSSQDLKCGLRPSARCKEPPSCLHLL